MESGVLACPGVSTHPAPSPLYPSVLTLFADVEWMPIHTRACVGTLIGYVYSLGQFLLAGVAYAVPRWRHLQMLVSVPFFAFFIYSWCVGPRGMRGPYPRSHRTPTPQNLRGSDPGQGHGMRWKDFPQGVQFSSFPQFSSLPALLPLPSTQELSSCDGE